MFVELFHGRKTANEQLEDWGTEGPIFGPFSSVSITYGSHVKLQAPRSTFDFVWNDQGLIEYDGVFYGDICVFSDLGAASDRTRFAGYPVKGADRG